MAEAPSLVALAAKLSDAKRRESKASKDRIEAEKAIIRATGFVKPEGQQKYEHEDDAGACQLVLKQPIGTSVDSIAWPKLRRTLDTKHPGRKVIVAKYSLDTKAARKLMEDDKAAWADVSAVITRKPGKVSVELKKLTLTGKKEAS